MKVKFLIGVIFLLSSCLESDTVSELEQLNKDIKKIDEFLAANPGNPGDIIVQDATGVRLVVTELGSGLFPPNPSNNLKVAYTGRLFSDGTIFDSNDAFFLKISDNIINGWKIGLSLMTQGSHAKLYIPSLYAYGASGQGSSIPGNSILVFDMYLESVTPTAEQNSRLALDIGSIDLELEENSIVAVEHPSGIRYVVTQIGDGSAPALYSQIKINYMGKLFSDETVFQSQIEVAPSSSFSSRVANYVSGLVIGLQLLQEGGKATFYVPSTLAYGTQTVTGVPVNSIVIFEIELLDVIE